MSLKSVPHSVRTSTLTVTSCWRTLPLQTKTIPPIRPTRTGIFEVWYEVTVDLDAFGPSGFGEPEIVDLHASPSKTGNNSEPVEFVECCGSSCTGSIDMTVLSGTPPYNFLWSNGSTTEDVDGLCSGDHSVEVTECRGMQQHVRIHGRR